MCPISPFVSQLFVLTVFVALLLFYFASSRNNIVLLILLGWIGLQTVLSLIGFYLNERTFPPRMLLLIGPPLLIMIMLFLVPKGRAFLDGFNIRILTWLHVVRIPVEITLWLLFINDLVPQLMTFEGRNYDVLSGLSAPLIALFAFRANTMIRPVVIIWNLACMVLLFNIVISATLSLPTTFQQLALEHPNTGVLYFPITLLPGVIVPMVLFSHLVTLRQALRK